MIAQFKSIFDLLKAFPTEQACIEHLEQLRWNGNVVSPFDASSKVYKCKGNRYKCVNTNKYFNVRTATIFEDTKLPLQKWFMALYVFSSHKKGISSHQLAKDIDITQKSAWFVLHRLRYAFDHPAFKAIVGDSGDGGEIVEMDETFVGGKGKNKHKSKRAELKKLGRGYANQTMVVGMLGRGIGVKAKVVFATPTMAVLHPIIRENIKQNTTLVTDGHGGYRGIEKEFRHEVIQHAKDEYVRGEFHTNSIEGFWSQLKRGVYGIYHHTSPEHLQAYVDEFALRYNTRTYSTADRFDMILSNVAGKRLTYENLIAK